MDWLRLVPIPQDEFAAELKVKLCETANGVLSTTQEMYARSGYVPPWIGYFALIDSSVVGTCAFKSPPKDGTVEIAYFTFPEHESRGIASKMTRQLIGIASEHAPDVQVTAHTMVDRNASHRILEKNGFIAVGTSQDDEDGTILVWRRGS